MTREERIERGLALVEQAEGDLRDSHRHPGEVSDMAALAAAHFLAAQVVPMPAPELPEVAARVMRDKDGDIWISFDGKHWALIDESALDYHSLDSGYEPFTEVRIVPLTS